MKTYTLTSALAMSEADASASLNGAIESFGKEGEASVVSVNAQEVEGGWIATIVVRVNEPEAEPDEDDDSSGKSSQSGGRDVSESNDADILWHGVAMAPRPVESTPDMTAAPVSSPVDSMASDMTVDVPPAPNDFHPAPDETVIVDHNVEMENAVQPIVQDLRNEFHHAELDPEQERDNRRIKEERLERERHAAPHDLLAPEPVQAA